MDAETYPRGKRRKYGVMFIGDQLTNGLSKIIQKAIAGFPVLDDTAADNGKEGK